MRIPKTLKVGGLEYEVYFEKHIARDDDALGGHCGNRLAIRVDEGLKSELQETTFLHEMLHAADFVYNLGMSHKLVHQLEAALYALIKDNPDVFRE